MKNRYTTTITIGEDEKRLLDKARASGRTIVEIFRHGLRGVTASEASSWEKFILLHAQMGRLLENGNENGYNKGSNDVTGTEDECGVSEEHKGIL